MFALTAQAYVGKDSDLRCAEGQKTLVDAVATYNRDGRADLRSELSTGASRSSTLPVSRTSTWNGAAFYTNYALNDQWRVSVRLEYLDDKDGFVTGHGIRHRR